MIFRGDERGQHKLSLTLVGWLKRSDIHSTWLIPIGIDHFDFSGHVNNDKESSLILKYEEE